MHFWMRLCPQHISNQTDAHGWYHAFSTFPFALDFIYAFFISAKLEIQVWARGSIVTHRERPSMCVWNSSFPNFTSVTVWRQTVQWAVLRSRLPATRNVYNLTTREGGLKATLYKTFLKDAEVLQKLTVWEK